MRVETFGKCRDKNKLWSFLFLPFIRVAIAVSCKFVYSLVIITSKPFSCLTIFYNYEIKCYWNNCIRYKTIHNSNVIISAFHYKTINFNLK